MKLEVLEGGIRSHAESAVLQEAWVTDTRLMGVVVLGLTWTFQDDRTERRHLFYFDCTEYGFSSFDEDGADVDFAAVERSRIGGLGARKIPVTEREALGLLACYLEFNASHGIPLPEEYFRDGEHGSAEDFYEERTAAGEPPDCGEMRTLFGKMSTETAVPEAAANYYLMRAFERDKEAVRFLSEKESAELPFPGEAPMTFYRNDVERTAENDGETAVRCVSVTGDSAGQYYQFVTELTIVPRRENGAVRLVVRHVRVLSRLPITDQEAFFNMRHPEYVMVYDCPDAEPFRSGEATAFQRNAQRIEESSGTAFLIYRPDNSYAASANFRIYDDLSAVYYIMNDGELVCFSYTEKDRLTFLLDLMRSEAGATLRLKGNYLFNEPVMNLLLHGGYLKFSDFLNEIQPDGA